MSHSLRRLHLTQPPPPAPVAIPTPAALSIVVAATTPQGKHATSASESGWPSHPVSQLPVASPSQPASVAIHTPTPAITASATVPPTLPSRHLHTYVTGAAVTDFYEPRHVIKRVDGDFCMQYTRLEKGLPWFLYIYENNNDSIDKSATWPYSYSQSTFCPPPAACQFTFNDEDRTAGS